MIALDVNVTGRAVLRMVLVPSTIVDIGVMTEVMTTVENAVGVRLVDVVGIVLVGAVLVVLSTVLVVRLDKTVEEVVEKLERIGVVVLEVEASVVVGAVLDVRVGLSVVATVGNKELKIDGNGLGNPLWRKTWIREVKLESRNGEYDLTEVRPPF
jgi:hypothetical protein